MRTTQPPSGSPALLQHLRERGKSRENRAADQITRFAGSMKFVYIHLIWFSLWIALGVEEYPFGLLTMIVSLEAIFLSTFVMISQNRADEKRQVIADEAWRTVQQKSTRTNSSSASPPRPSSSPSRSTRRATEDAVDMNRPQHPSPRLSTLVSSGWHPVEPPRRPVLFVNPRSGDGAATRNRVVEQAHERGVRAVTLDVGDDLRTRALEAVADGADALGMAGGDGSLATVAAVAAAHGLPFVCVPAGTRNHFAKDLGVDRRDVAGALDAFTDGVERLIDVGEVNGRIFLNNVSLGIYGEAVQLAGYRDTKVRTLAETAHSVLAPTGAHSGASPHRRHRTRARTARGRPRLQQRLRVDGPRPRDSTHALRRPAGNPGARHTRRDATPSGPSMERPTPAGPCPRDRPRRHRRRGRRALRPPGRSPSALRHCGSGSQRGIQERHRQPGQLQRLSSRAIGNHCHNVRCAPVAMTGAAALQVQKPCSTRRPTRSTGLPHRQILSPRPT